MRIAYDGNLITSYAGATAQSSSYDGWNRLASSGGKSYTYDALGRRITESDGTTTKHLYYSDKWQVIEERNSSGATKAQYVWSPVYVDALIERDRDADNSSTTGTGGLEERLYVMQDGRR